MIHVIARRFYGTLVHDEVKGKEPRTVSGVEVHEFQKRTRYVKRPDYKLGEAFEVAGWLNEREALYPVPVTLAHLWNAHYDKARPKTRKRKARARR